MKNCFEKFNCGGMCCYDGVYVTESDIERIKECIKRYPEYFKKEEYFETSQWKDYKGKLKTKTKNRDSVPNNYPEHFEKTKCIFQMSDGRCILEYIALKNNEYKWKYKPTSCYLFPLKCVKNRLIPPIENKEEDANIYDDYDGYESCLPCFKQNKNYKETLKEEIEFYKRFKENKEGKRKD
ncbi:MAG: hypothetical protein Q4G05_02795 [Clostridia bacterium]|nr:hypothetical protein [Clostridia bacterium]